MLMKLVCVEFQDIILKEITRRSELGRDFFPVLTASVEEEHRVRCKKLLESPPPGKPFAHPKRRALSPVVLFFGRNIDEVGIANLRIPVPLKHRVNRLRKLCAA
jgi:hypothetical protein